MSAPTRILWIVNIVLPAVATELGLSKTPFGGWLTLMTDRLALRDDFRIAVAMRAPVKTLTRIEKNGIVYYAMPQSASDAFDVDDGTVAEVLADFVPEVLHAEGSEMAYTRRFLKAWAGPKLLSLQGVINGNRNYDLGRLPLLSMLNPLRPKTALTAVALMANFALRFLPRLKAERETIQLADHIMGRTVWDRAQAWAINPDATYHHCSRILRDGFYGAAWDSAGHEPHSIFVGNAASPRKGTHVVIEAVRLLRRAYPDIRLYVAGESPMEAGSSFKRHVGYPAYVCDLIDRHGLKDRVTFTGLLDEPGMVRRMEQSHVFVMSSIIENSPNTLGEAMMVGTPSVSSFTGGVPSMASDEVDVLMYRADDPAMLAIQIKRLFDDPALCGRLSASARKRARQTHDPEANVQALVAAYDRISGSAEEASA
ncbi:MAG: glycosyltransferase family 4 protein [Brevundimonas sp.]|uniref:glycosyltransferase family 4 protein n=1 Tax=Brevundimonas sp. TaxID=1871086 RepID=UPI002ABBB516|nr:glycosyltransferase family 4 protein [Brevundimonas sp.]MDZ4109889.1 glycosyltransferase family 4 protein [Brevundimonas sp.]